MTQVSEVFQNWSEGMNGGVFPALIGEYQYAKGINVTCRGGVIRTRPPFLEIGLASADEATLQNIQYGKFQGIYPYQYQDTQYLAFAFSGRVYILDPIAGLIVDLTATTGPLSNAVARLYFCQVENYLVVQDGINRALIALNTAGTFAAGNQVPVGTVMAYGQGRLFVKTAPGQFLAGDINLPSTPAAVLNFTETVYLAGGGAFFTPSYMGSITGMAFVQQFGTATGLGPLMVFCKHGICSYDVSTGRLFWQDQSIMKIEAGGNGNVSHLGMVKMDDDILFRTWGGINDFALMSSQQSNKQRITNLNLEVLPFLDPEDVSMLPYTSACRFNDRVLYTVAGEQVTAQNIREGGSDTVADYRFKGIISLDFAPMDGISTMGEVVKPSYDGVWTGVYPMGIASGIFSFEERCFMFGKDNDGKNHLFEIGAYPGHDDGNIPINCRLYSRMTPFVTFTGNRPSKIPHYLKTLHDAWLWVSELKDRVEFKLWARADRCFDFFNLSDICLNALSVDPVTGGPGQMQCAAKVQFPELKWTECQQITGRLANTGFEFELMLEWTGIAQISRFMLGADSNMDEPSVPCDCSGEVLVGTERDDYDYSTYAGVGAIPASTITVNPIPTPEPGPGPIPGRTTKAPITGGSGTQDDPFTVSGNYDSYPHASDAAISGNALPGEYMTCLILNYSETFTVWPTDKMFGGPIVSGTGTNTDPFKTSGVFYAAFGYGFGIHAARFSPDHGGANDAAFKNIRWPVSSQLGGLWQPSYPDLSFPWIKAYIYYAVGAVYNMTFSAWDPRYPTSGVLFTPGGGAGTLASPWQIRTAGPTSPYIDFASAAAAQYHIRRTGPIDQVSLIVPTIGDYFRVSIGGVEQTVQISST